MALVLGAGLAETGPLVRTELRAITWASNLGHPRHGLLAPLCPRSKVNRSIGLLLLVYDGVGAGA